MEKNKKAAKTPAMRNGIREFIQRQPRATIAEVARHMNTGRTTARYHLQDMVKAGQLTRDENGKYSATN